MANGLGEIAAINRHRFCDVVRTRIQVLRSANNSKRLAVIQKTIRRTRNELDSERGNETEKSSAKIKTPLCHWQVCLNSLSIAIIEFCFICRSELTEFNSAFRLGTFAGLTVRLDFGLRRIWSNFSDSQIVEVLRNLPNLLWNIQFPFQLTLCKPASLFFKLRRNLNNFNPRQVVRLNKKKEDGRSSWFLRNTFDCLLFKLVLQSEWIPSESQVCSS